jgi:hypothetical protein
MSDEIKGEIAMLMERGLVRTYGEKTGRLLDLESMAKTIQGLNKRRVDIVAPRKALTAAGNGNLFFNFGSIKDYLPTTVALGQVAAKTRIPAEFLRENAVRYPALAANMINTWWKDDAVANREGTTKARKERMKAEDMKQLYRLFDPPEPNMVLEAPPFTPLARGILRAVLSSRYLIVNNADVLGFVMGLIEKAGVKTDPSGSFNDERMHVRFKVRDMAATIQFKNKGKGHEAIRVPCGASFLLTNSDVGIGALTVVPELEVFSCTNLVRSVESLAQIHVGREYDEMGVLTNETIQAMTSSLFLRIRDVVQTLLTEDSFQKVADKFAEFAGNPIERVSDVVENVTEKFSLGEDVGRKILDKYAESGMANRFGLAQAITFQAHQFREDDFEKALALEDAGSKILRMPETQFRKELAVVREK